MRMYDLIHKKCLYQPLSPAEIGWFVKGFTKGEIPDYQASALLMAIRFAGMTHEETAALTREMMLSGDTVNLSRFGALSVDKHSTGGVGDKTSLIVCPIAAALGAKVAKMSGRGLGHTGGTIDKLEAIPGFRTAMANEEFLLQVEEIGLAIVGQTGNLAPADKKLYALRDVTATVDCVPLIASSVMSKKLAAGAHSIVLDVKVGSGAFMKTPEQGLALAGEMVAAAKAFGRKARALITDMDTPLGYCVGNAIEVEEAVRVLRGEQKDDLYELCCALAANMVSLARGIGLDRALELVHGAVENGSAFAKMLQWVQAQGGDASVLQNTALLPRAAHTLQVKASRNGYLCRMDAEQIGLCAMEMGAGRACKEDTIDPAAGLRMEKKTGDRVNAGDVLATLYTNKASTLPRAEQLYLQALTLGDTPPEKKPLLYKVVED